MSEDVHLRSYIYEGMRLVRSEPVAQLRPEVGEDRTIHLPWKAKVYREMFVGHVYDIPTSEDGTRFTVSRATHVRPMVGDDKTRQAMITAHRASLVALDATKRRERLAKSDVHMGAIIAPLIPAYAECKTWEAQCAFEALVLTALRKARMEWRG